MIVVDTSALIAVLLGEPAALALAERLARSPVRLLSAANYIEFGTVLAGRARLGPDEVRQDVDQFLNVAGIEVAPVDAALAREALEARIRFGKGFGAAAGLNFGDCFAYALARRHKAPLLYVGNDFARTDVEAAL